MLSHPLSVLTQPPLWTPEADGIPATETNKPFIKVAHRIEYPAIVLIRALLKHSTEEKEDKNTNEILLTS